MPGSLPEFGSFSWSGRDSVSLLRVRSRVLRNGAASETPQYHEDGAKIEPDLPT